MPTTLMLKFAIFTIQIMSFFGILPLLFFQELKPTLDELGISLPEELGYDKPELMLQNPYLDNV